MINANDGDIDREVGILIKMAEAYDKGSLPSPLVQESEKEFSDYTYLGKKFAEREKLARKAQDLINLCRGQPMSETDKQLGYSRYEIMYLLSCQLYTLAKEMHKESFLDKL